MKKTTPWAILATAALTFSACDSRTEDVVKGNSDDAKKAVEIKADDTKKAVETDPVETKAVETKAEQARKSAAKRIEAAKAKESAKDALAPSASPTP